MESWIGHPEGVPDARLAQLLDAELQRSRDLGFLGSGPIGSHVRNARAFVGPLDVTDALPTTSVSTKSVSTKSVSTNRPSIVDLGSGGGVPGLVIALLVPAATVVLLDGSDRRCAFLDDAVVRLCLSDRVTVVCARAEVAGRDPAHRGRYDRVVARSFGAPAVTAECAAPLLAPGNGTILVSEPPEEHSTANQDRWPAAELAELGLEPHRRYVEHGTSIQVLRSTGPCPERYPRRVGIPTKRPLF